jgi:hypothetical protein
MAVGVALDVPGRQLVQVFHHNSTGGFPRLQVAFEIWKVRQQLLQLLLADREGQYNQLKKNKEKVKNRF